jgi:hypothetical protein
MDNVDATSEWIVEHDQEAQEPLSSEDKLLWLEQTTNMGRGRGRRAFCWYPFPGYYIYYILSYFVI